MSTRQESPNISLARDQAALGLPLPEGARLRPVKRAIYRVSWLFLSHQAAFNSHVIDALSELQQRVDEIVDHQSALSSELTSAIDLRLLQAEEEIGDHVATTRSALAELTLQIAKLVKDVSGLSETIQGRAATDRPDHEGG